MISAEDLNFLHNIAAQLENIHYYCDSKPGIVTAANSFFIINQNTELQYNLEQYAHPIIQKGLFVNGSIVFNQLDYVNLINDGKPTKVLCFSDEEAQQLPQGVLDYLEIGEEMDLPNRYKCKKRKNWFVIPNISTVPDGFFFKRSHYYPKLLKNNAGVFVTDSGYKISMREGFNINHLIFSFYNSLTLAFSELTGRYYGGGVLELTPQEFKKIPIPFTEIGTRDFNTYTREFENKKEILNILEKNDFHILNGTLNLTLEEVKRVRNIYSNLISKRMRNNKKIADTI